LASQGILLTNYYAVTHPSEPNYVAVVGGDDFGIGDDSLHAIPQQVASVVDLLEDAGISWAEYEEDMPYTGFQGFNYTDPVNNYVEYVRKHNPLVFISIVGYIAKLGHLQFSCERSFTALKYQKLYLVL
jgi:acid phosphatase